jgi:hypothetical protein
MRKVTRYPLPATAGRFTIVTPGGAQFIGITAQSIHALADTSRPEVPRTLLLVDTEQNIPGRSRLAHIGTSGNRHLFEENPR